MKYIKTILILLSFPFMVFSQVVNTPFTYQGELMVNGAPANGSYDMTFDAFGMATGGSSLLTFGSDAHLGVTVSNGIFTVQNVDFGNLVFTGGADTWIELAVKPAGSGSYVTLSPRQKITSAPYAIKSDFANTASQAADLSVAASANDVLVYDGSNWKSGGTKIRVSNIGVSVGTTSVPPANGLRVGGVANFDNDLNQNINKSGLPKYMISATCGNGTTSITTKDLTGNNGQATIQGSTTAGYCFITFPVSILNNFWIASSVDNDGGTTSCASVSNVQLNCQRVNKVGTYVNGDFQLIIF